MRTSRRTGSIGRTRPAAASVRCTGSLSTAATKPTCASDLVLLMQFMHMRPRYRGPTSMHAPPPSVRGARLGA